VLIVPERESSFIMPNVSDEEPRPAEASTEKVTLLTTEWCGYCRRLKRQMDEAGIAYREVDIDLHRSYGERIAAVTGGNWTVPSVEVGGRLLVNPSVAEVDRALGRTS
jgi:mycoredoxin